MGYTKVIFWLLLTLFLIPAITLGFAEYGNRSLNQEYTQFFIEDAQKQHQDAGKLAGFLQQNPPSAFAARLPKICSTIKKRSAHRVLNSGSST
jgi:cell division protein FtsL